MEGGVRKGGSFFNDGGSGAEEAFPIWEMGTGASVRKKLMVLIVAGAMVLLIV